MNNKPGLAPLCSSTRSGKMIDRVIKVLKTANEFTFEKSNLYDLDYWPEEDQSPGVYQWAQRVEFTTDDIVVTLGSAVNDRFRKWSHLYVSIGHPAMHGGIHRDADSYVARAVAKILEFVTKKDRA